MQSLQTIFINPQYATNNYDANAPGWYVTSPSNSNLALRVQYSNLSIAGEIRLNSSTGATGPTGSTGSNIFQGYDGSSWVDFNAVVGPTGSAGLDFTNQVNFINTSNLSADTINPVTFGNVFSTTYSNVANNISNVYVRSLYAGNVTISSNDSIPSLLIAQNSNVITLTSQPLPYQWEFTSNAMIANYKSGSGDMVFKASGDVSQWLVKTGYSVVRGSAVRIANDGDSVAIVPMMYSSTSHINPFAVPANVIGIALEDSIGGETCLVCTKGVTTVVCTNNTSLDFNPTSGLSDVGLPGLVGCDSGIFCNSMIPAGEYIRAGFFLESGLSIAGNNQYVLFNVDIKLSLG